MKLSRAFFFLILLLSFAMQAQSDSMLPFSFQISQTLDAALSMKNFSTPSFFELTQTQPSQSSIGPNTSRAILKQSSRLASRRDMPSLTLTSPQTETATRKLDPFLRFVVRRTDYSDTSASTFTSTDLASFANLVAIYESEHPLGKSIPLNTLGPFKPQAIEEPTSGFADRIGVLIKIKSNLKTPIRVDSRAGNILTARLTLDEIKALTNDSAVEFIQAGYRVRPTLDESVPSVKGDKLHNEKPAAKGKGVIIGIIDTGLDYDHLDFRYDKDGDGIEESTRVLYLWDQTETNDGAEPEGASYGTEYTRAQIEKDIAAGCQVEESDECLVQERDEVGHGTHVTGIAAGDGSAANSKFIGMAPEAEIIFVKTTYYENQIIDAVQYVFEKAQALGRPAVVNLSLGGHFGPHDGSSGFEQGLNQLLGRPGQIIVTSAGNEGNDKIHAGCRFFSDCQADGGIIGNKASYRFIVGPDNRAFLNFWYPPQAIYTVTVESPDGLSASVITGQSATRRSARGEMDIDNASSGTDPRNGLNPLTISLNGTVNGDAWTITIEAHKDGGRFDGWPGLSSMGHFEEGDTLMTVSEPANAPALISVGAYTTKEKWESIQGKPFQFQEHSKSGEIAVFSSHGPTRDGRIKPNLTAPGTAIISTLAAESAFATEEGYRSLIAPDGQHSALQGTSMAAPHVTGAIAMMLQSNPHLTAYEALQQLQKSAYDDSFTQVCPDLRDTRVQPLAWCWGTGKLEAQRSVDTAGLAPAQFGTRPQIKVGPNPAKERVIFFYSLPPLNEEGLLAKSADLVIYDIRGKIVHQRALSLTSSRAEWNLTDEQGRLLPNGLYIFVVQTDGVRSTPQRLIVQHR